MKYFAIVIFAFSIVIYTECYSVDKRDSSQVDAYYIETQKALSRGYGIKSMPIYSSERTMQICNTNSEEMDVWNRENHCDIQQQPDKQIDFDSNTYGILSKLHQTVSGVGYECKIIVHRMWFMRDFWFTNSELSEQEHKNLSEEECRAMIETKVCNGPENDDGKNGMPMKSTGLGSYEYVPEFHKVFSWMSTNYVLKYQCHIESRIIQAESIDQNLFGKNCKAFDKKCKLDRNIIVWNDTVIHSCPFDLIQKIHLTKSNNFAVNMNENIAFKIKNITNQCKLPMYETEEGSFLIKWQFLKDLQKEHIHIKLDENKEKANAKMEGLLATIDYDAYYNNKNLDLLKREECRNFYNTLNSLSGLENIFTRIITDQHEERIVFSKGGNIFFPICLSVENVRAYNSSRCFENLPVLYDLSQMNGLNQIKPKRSKGIKGFMTTTNVIIPSSKEIDCPNTSRDTLGINFLILNLY